MKNKIGIKISYSCIIFLLACFLSFTSCSKVNEERAQKEASSQIEDAQKVDDNNLNENAEDLMRVDYKQFYDELSPHGEWVQVKASDLGIDINKLKMQAQNDPVHRESILDILTGLNTANAETDADVDFGMFFVWQPAPDLAVSLDVSNEQPARYIPYSNGQWVNSEDGWYFQAATPYEDITCHYGRWAYADDMGWVWVPGRVWAPAWVDWREDDDYIAWTPLPPGAYIEDNIIIDPFPVVVDNYVVIDRQYFCDPECYHHIYYDREHWDRCRVMSRTDGIFVERSTVINRGPNVTEIEKVTGKHFDPVKINRVDNISKVKYTGKEINTYSPRFVKDASDVKRKAPVSQPKSFKEFANVKQKDNSRMPEKQPNTMNENKKQGITQKDGSNGNNKNGNLKNNNQNIQKFSNKNYRKDQGNNIKKNNGSNNKGNVNKSPNVKQKNNNKGNNNNGNNKQPRINNKQPGNQRGNNKQPPSNKQPGNQRGNNKQPPSNKQPGNQRGNNKQPPSNKQPGNTQHGNSKQSPPNNRSGNNNSKGNNDKGHKK